MIVPHEGRPGNSPGSTTYLLAFLANPFLFILKVLQTSIFPLSGTNWVGQILNDLVAIFEKKTQNKESSMNDEELEEFPYLEIGDTGKFEVGTEYV